MLATIWTTVLKWWGWSNCVNSINNCSNEGYLSLFKSTKWRIKTSLRGWRRKQEYQVFLHEGDSYKWIPFKGIKIFKEFGNSDSIFYMNIGISNFGLQLIILEPSPKRGYKVKRKKMKNNKIEEYFSTEQKWNVN